LLCKSLLYFTINHNNLLSPYYLQTLPLSSLHCSDSPFGWTLLHKEGEKNEPCCD
jgi:hypothetical protein